MYTHARLPMNLDGLESLNFASYWTAIKDKIEDLRNLPTWATNHAMKLGVTVSNLQKQGKTAEIEALSLEIRKVNDDIAKAWIVRQYIDQYLPQWMSVASSSTGSGAPIVPQQNATPVIAAPQQQVVQPYVQPTFAQEVTGWFGSLFGSGVHGHNDRGLGIIPILAISMSTSAIAALAYVVTTGMSLWQDYRFKKDLTQSVIEGKVTSGQFAQIVTASRPPESFVEKITAQVGGNVATIAVLAGLGYLGFMYYTSKKSFGR